MTRPQPASWNIDRCDAHRDWMLDIEADCPDPCPDCAYRPVFDLKVPLVNEKPPLSANQRLHWRAKADRTATVRESVAWRAKQAGVRPQMHVIVQLHYAPQDRRRRDPSNLMATQKAAVDGLVDAGVVPDDTPLFVTELMPVIHEPDGGAKRMWLRVEVGH